MSCVPAQQSAHQQPDEPQQQHHFRPDRRRARHDGVIVILLAPFVEEVLFRGLVFGNLKGKSRAAGYLVSCLLFALLHVWQFALVNQDITYFLLMVQYLVPGLVLAWTYEHSGTLWTAIALHAAANALSVWTML